VREVLPNAVEVRQEWPRSEPQAARAAADWRARAPAELFADYHRREHGQEPPAPLLELFAELHEQVRHEGEAP